MYQNLLSVMFPRSSRWVIIYSAFIAHLEPCSVLFFKQPQYLCRYTAFAMFFDGRDSYVPVIAHGIKDLDALHKVQNFIPIPHQLSVFYNRS